jgi:SAM-dependent methyltransferase
MLESTGERFLPEMEGAYIAYEHWHRYLLATSFVKDKAVLDVASGEGYGSNLLAAEARSVVGVDIEPAAVQHAEAAYARPNLRFLCGPAEEIPIPGQHLFDVLVSFETLEHLSPESQRQFLKEIQRLLRPGGLLLISTPNQPIYSEQNRHQNPFHQHEFSRAEFLRFLKEFFPSIKLLSQRVYPGSYIWNVEHPTCECAEYQLALRDGRLQPVSGDGKEELYYIALCSQDGSCLAPNSVLFDLSETAVRGLPGHVTTLFVDSGAGFRAEECYQQLLDCPSDFQLDFRLSESAPVRGLRWDPVEMRTSRVRLTAVSWRTPAGEAHSLDLDAVSSNGTPEGPGCYRFDTFDPMMYLPVQGPVVRLTIKGHCEVDDVATSMRRLHEVLEANQIRSAAREQYLHELEDRSSQARQQVAALESQLRGLESQLAATAQEQLAARASLQACEEDRTRLVRHIQNYDKERSEILAQWEALEDDRAQLQDHVACYETERARFAVCLRAAEQLRLRWSVDLQATRDQARQTEEERARLAASVHALEEERLSLKQQLRIYREENPEGNARPKFASDGPHRHWVSSLGAAVARMPRRLLWRRDKPHRKSA